MSATLPELERSPSGNALSGSWVFSHPHHTHPVEVFDRAQAEYFLHHMKPGTIVETAHQYLTRLSRELKQGA